ncbi:MAG: transglutaminase-like domain-containing protein [Prevotellaceae bacterium]|jgi:transglutaminase-like putative cysteine protease|nr:transglutaminase-like domain-containing protein [Prevotellaceae bacterium]
MNTMNKTGHISLKQFLRQMLFLGIPTILVVYVLVYTTSDHFPLFNHSHHLSLTLYFSCGVLLSLMFHSFRFRFLPAFIVLILLFAGTGFILDNFAFGEFDSFFLSIDFLLFRVLFISGWICGWGFSRSKYFPAALSTVLLSISVIITAISGKTDVGYMMRSFTPALVYAFYIIFMNELLRNTDEKELRSWTVPLKGFLLYSTAMVLILFVVFNIFRSEIKTLEVKWVEGTIKNDNQNSLYDMLPDSTIQMKDAMQVNDNLNRNAGQNENVTLFVAYIDNFFPDSDTPNPLYFVSEYLTLFDDYTETFEPDTLAPYYDLFSPDPSSIPMYFTATDMSVIEKGMSQTFRKVVEAEVYKVKASPQEFTAPSTAFYCQPVAVKNDAYSQYTSAYRTKMWVSELNSAYFVYNNTEGDMSMYNFQKQRFDILQSVKNFDSADTAFVNYYTRYPDNPAYDTIKALATAIVEEAGAITPIDKILAVRDYFMRTDEDGYPVYKYSDVATTVPPGTRILNFLLNDHTGNCTYYAGSAFLLLRACGIPARIATGYAVVDRSSNNKGWYWIYNKQAHAWVQVFFPEYGWLDFDTTVGDSEQSEAPGTDGTPPLDPQKAWLAATGKVLNVDTVGNFIQLSTDRLVYFDREYILDSPYDIKLDVSLATLYKDSAHIKLREIKKDDRGLAISFTRTDDVTESKKLSINSILKNLPSPVPVDEFRLEVKKKEPTTADGPSTDAKKKTVNPFLIAILTFAAILLAALIMIFSIPYIIYKVYANRARRMSDPKKDAYYAYRAAMFLMHQMGYFRNDLTPLQYAGQVIDKNFGTLFEAFTAIYLKVKYANQELTSEDSQRIIAFYMPFEQAVMSKISRKKRVLHFMNIYNTLEFFTKPRQPD